MAPFEKSWTHTITTATCHSSGTWHGTQQGARSPPPPVGPRPQTVAGGGQHGHPRHFRGKGRGYAVYYEDDEHDPDHEWQDDPNYDYEEGCYEDEAYSQDPSPTAADSYVDETYEDFDNDAAYYQTLADVDPAEQAEFDSAYATYIDARRRFNEIKLSSGATCQVWH